MNFTEKKELRKKADLVFEKTLDLVFENKEKENLINELWSLSSLGEELAYENFMLEKYEDIKIDDLSKEDKLSIKDYSEKRIKTKLEYYTLFLKIIEKYNK